MRRSGEDMRWREAAAEEEDYMERHEMIRRDMRWREAGAEEGGLYGET